MEHSTKFKARLGVFVAIAIVLFLAAIFYIGRQKHMFDPVFKLSSKFRDVGGLQIGNNVRFSGINVGTVDNIIILDDTTVQVDVIIDQHIHKFIKDDCFMTIGSEGLIGDKIIHITQGGSGQQVTPGQFLTAVEPVSTDAILGSLKVTAENAEIVSDELAQILYKINSGQGTFGMLINDSSMADNITSTIQNLKRSTKGLDENMEAAKHNILLRGYYKNKKRKEEQLKKEKNSGSTKEKQSEETDSTEGDKKAKWKFWKKDDK
jgi:phospholipid/cholesterol/gamma-HCH transport system substrate-binding protein